MSERLIETVSVTLIDEASGETLATSKVPVTQLPDSFALETSLAVAGQRYTVVRAQPPTKAEFASEGRLALHLHKVEALDPSQILFSLPTICGAALPESAAGRAPGGVCVVHEDDWRQCELLALAHGPDIAAELADIQQIYATAAAETGWRKLHVRERIAQPLPRGVKWREVTARLGARDSLGGVTFGDGRLLVRGAVAVTMRNGVVVWGIESRDELTVLCLQNGAAAAPSTIAALKTLAETLSLVLVDWCRCRVYCPGGGRIEGALGSPWDEVQ